MMRPGICSICGKMADPVYTCRLCGAMVCSNCFIASRAICRRCAGGLTAEDEDED